MKNPRLANAIRSEAKKLILEDREAAELLVDLARVVDGESYEKLFGPIGTTGSRMLGRALRSKASTLAGADVVDASELINVLARLAEGKELVRAFGAPGDWGYGTTIGDVHYQGWEKGGAS